jgi:hypothetical protein
VIVDVDFTLVTAHSDKEHAGPTFKKTSGFAPMRAFVDHGEHGTGEPVVLDPRPGTAQDGRFCVRSPFATMPLVRTGPRYGGRTT